MLPAFEWFKDERANNFQTTESGD